jgi:nicotinate-nucleotide pyrophosphorylase (carboxylating)
MLKDNHFASAGGDPADVVRSVKSRMSHTVKLIAEAQTPAMGQALALAGADIVLLDNFRPPQIAEAVKLIAGRALIEVSGGVNESNLADFLIPGVDVISIGALTHSAAALDISLQFEIQ